MKNALRWTLIGTLILLVLGSYVALNYVALLFLRAAIPSFPASAVAALGLSSILCLFLVRIDNLVTRVYYIFGMVWMGLVPVIAVYFPILVLLHRVGLPYGAWMLLPLGIIAIYSMYAALVPRIVEVKVASHKLRKPARIAQLSDVHVGAIYREQFLADTVARVNRLKPDVVVITGDLFDGTSVDPAMIAPLRKLKAPVLFISGNHEEFGGMRKSLDAVRENGITILDGKRKAVAGVEFIGVAYEDHEARILRKLPAATVPRVVLRHMPYPAGVGDLQLSGHTHRGQIWPLNYLVLLQFPVMSGVYRRGDFTMYVSQGTGTWGPPMRLGSRSEITMITLS